MKKSVALLRIENQALRNRFMLLKAHNDKALEVIAGCREALTQLRAELAAAKEEIERLRCELNESHAEEPKTTAARSLAIG